MRLDDLITQIPLWRPLLFRASCSLPSRSFAKDDDRFPICVLAGGGEAGGFSDASGARIDSAIDVMDRLKKSKVLRLVKIDTDTVIVLVITGRETKDRQTIVRATLTAGIYSTSIEANAGPNASYRAAADQLGYEVDTWAKANTETLRTLRPKTVTTK